MVLPLSRRGRWIGGASIYPSPNANISSTKLFKVGGTTGGANITHSSLTFCEGRYTGGNIVLLNGLATSVTIDGVLVAPTSVENDGYNPLDSGGAAQAWTTVSGGPWTIPAASVPGTGAGVYSVLRIPFTLASIDRTDIVGAPCLIMIRIHAATATSAASPTSGDMNGVSTITTATRKQQGYWKSQTLANFNIPANFTTPTQQFFEAIGVEFTTAVTSYSVLVLGDSTFQGAQSTSNYWPGSSRAAAALSSLIRPISIINCGVQGQTTTQTFAAADGLIAAFSPQAVTIPFYSVNNVPSTQAAADAILATAMTLAAKCVRSGIKPFLVTPNPASSISASNDVFRRQVIVNAKAGPYTVIDQSAAISDGATPERIIPAYTADGTHCNDAGYDQQDTLAWRPAFVTWLPADNILLSGDMQSGIDTLLLSGDMQSGTDALLLEGSR